VVLEYEQNEADAVVGVSELKAFFRGRKIKLLWLIVQWEKPDGSRSEWFVMGGS
jgi:hypothetical protein